MMICAYFGVFKSLNNAHFPPTVSAARNYTRLLQYAKFAVQLTKETARKKNIIFGIRFLHQKIRRYCKYLLTICPERVTIGASN